MTTEAAVLADVYDLLLTDIRRNRAARLAAQQQNNQPEIKSLADTSDRADASTSQSADANNTSSTIERGRDDFVG